MEISTKGHIDTDSPANNSKDDDFFHISSNWELLGNNKCLRNTISSISMKSATQSMTLEDIVDETTCVEMKPKSGAIDSCSIEVKLKDGRKIYKMGVVSEARILEIFKEFGEYEMTVHAEFIDEYEGQSVNFAEVTFDRPTTETTIQFTKMKKDDRSTMFLYGIRLLLQDSPPPKAPQISDSKMRSDIFGIPRSDRHKDQTKLSTISSPVNPFNAKILVDSLKLLIEPELQENNNPSLIHPNNQNTVIDKELIEDPIDTKLRMIEQNLMQRIDNSEAKICRKLDDILKKIESIST